jgi:hypothetical protein
MSEFWFVHQFRFASSSGSLLSFGSAILLIARCASVRLCCPHSQFCPRPRFVHILVLVHILNVSSSILSNIPLSRYCYFIISLFCIILVSRLTIILSPRFPVPVRLSECVELSTRHRPVVTVSRPFVRVRRTIRHSSVPSRYLLSSVCQSQYNCQPFHNRPRSLSVLIRFAIAHVVTAVLVCQSSYNCPHARLPSRFVIGVPSFVRVRITVRRLAIAPSSRFSVVYYNALRPTVWSFP